MNLRAPNINKVIISGNVVKDFDLKVLDSGSKVITFDVAHNEGYWDRNSKSWVDKQPTFFSVTAWNNLAESMAERLHKGSPVLIEGKLELRRWKYQGQDRQRLEIKAMSIQALEKKNRGEYEPGEDAYNEDPEANGYDGDPEYDDDIPF